jgi:hypothetical protein
MRDRTRRRNYSPGAEEFRRVHKHHRDRGLIQRHAQKLRRLHASGDVIPTPAASSARPQTREPVQACGPVVACGPVAYCGPVPVQVCEAVVVCDPVPVQVCEPVVVCEPNPVPVCEPNPVPVCEPVAGQVCQPAPIDEPVTVLVCDPVLVCEPVEVCEPVPVLVCEPAPIDEPVPPSRASEPPAARESVLPFTVSESPSDCGVATTAPCQTNPAYGPPPKARGGCAVLGPADVPAPAAGPGEAHRRMARPFRAVGRPACGHSLAQRSRSCFMPCSRDRPIDAGIEAEIQPGLTIVVAGLRHEHPPDSRRERGPSTGNRRAGNRRAGIGRAGIR